MLAEDLFIAEADLRQCARDLATWEVASNKTSTLLNEANKGLRAAARRYARLADELEHKTGAK